MLLTRTMASQFEDDEGTGGVEPFQAKNRRASGLQILTGLGRRLSSGGSGSAGPSPSSADSRYGVQ